MICVYSHRRAWALVAVAIIAFAGVASVHAATTGKVVIIQSNSARDRVSLIEPTTDTVVGEITGIEVGHGVAASPDGTRIYVTNESLATVDVVDAATLKITKRIPLTGPPNNIAIRKDGQRVYAAITGANGGVDIIDTAKLEKISPRAPCGRCATLRGPFTERPLSATRSSLWPPPTEH